MNDIEQSKTNSKNINFTISKGSFYRTLVLTFLIGIAVAALVVTLFFKFSGSGRMLTGDELKYYESLQNTYGKYYDMRETIKNNSIYDADDSALDSAIANDVLAIVPDKYAEYYTPEEYEKFSRKYLNSYSGIGVSTEMTGKRIEIKRVIEGGPAEEAGIRAGDFIVSIDGKEPKDLDEASELISGDTGSKVEMAVDRNGTEKTFTIYRKEVEDKSVSSEVYDKKQGIGYVKIASFREGTADEFEAAVKDLKAKACDEIIIDLRGNTGGVVEESIKTADLLLPACKIVTVRNNKGKEKVYNSEAGNLNIEYVIVVDEYTASASEIVAGAVKDNKGGKLVGARTYGKGMIQSIFELDDGSVFKITTEEYILPKGELINEVGIEPDFFVDPAEDPISTAESELLN